MEQFLEQDKLSCAASLRKTWKTLQGGEIDGISCLDFFFFYYYTPCWHVVHIVQFCSLFEKFRRPGL